MDTSKKPVDQAESRYDHSRLHSHTPLDFSGDRENGSRTGLAAVLGYMVQHNEHYVDELEGLIGSIPEEYRDQFCRALGLFDSARAELGDVIALLSSAPGKKQDGEDADPAKPDGNAALGEADVQGTDKKRQINRISRIIGHLDYVKRMLKDGADCGDVLVQISASKSALNGLGKQVIGEYLDQCLQQAVENGNSEAAEEFRRSVEKYL